MAARRLGFLATAVLLSSALGGAPVSSAAEPPAPPAAVAATSTDGTVRRGTDSVAALQAPGGVSVQAYLSSSTTNAPVLVRFDDLSVVAAAGP